MLACVDMLRLLGVLLALMSGVAVAQSPREELQQLTAQVLNAPGDHALRERIIKLAKEVKPPPAISETTERHLARGRAAFRSAKDANDYKEAVREFSQASLAAPWLHDAYYNLGVAQDKAGEYGVAMQSLKLAALSAATAEEARGSRELLYEVEFRHEKATQASRPPDFSALQGIWTSKEGPFTFFHRLQVAGDTIRFGAERYESASGSHNVSPGFYGQYRLKEESGAFKGVYVEGTQLRPCAGRESPATAVLAPGGREMTVTLQQMFYYASRNNVVDANSCAREPKPDYKFVLRKQ